MFGMRSRRQNKNSPIKTLSRRWKPVLETLEDRTVPSTIVWTNRVAADNFNAIYGGNAALARTIVDRAISDWQTVINNFNYANVGTPGWAPVANTFAIQISAAPISGRGVTNSIATDPAGKPYFANIVLDDDAQGTGWYFDPVPSDDAEYTTLLSPNGRFAAQSATPLQNDLYRTIVHELGHAMGILLGGSNAINSFTSFIGADPVSAGSNVYLFNNAGVQATLTDMGGGHTYEGPAIGANPVETNDLMNDGRTVNVGINRRQLISDIDAQILSAAYGYTITLPSTINTFYATLNATTGNVLVQGDPGNSNDIFRIDRVGANIRFQVNGTSELIPAASITSITVQGAGGNDSLTVDLTGGSVPVPITYDGGTQTSTPGDFLGVIGSGAPSSGSYVPSGTTNGSGVVTADGQTISFSNLEPVVVSSFGSFTMTTPNSNDVLTVTSPSGGQGLITGTSGGVAFESLQFNAIGSFTLAAGTNDGGNPVDSVDFQSLQGANNFTTNLGNGNDTVKINGAGVFATLTINGENGNDTFTINSPSTSNITINGGLPVAGDPGVPPGDKLIVNIFGANVFPFNSPDGIVTVPGGANINFTSIETLVIPDRFEFNNTVATATFLGSPPFQTLDRLSIHSVDDPLTPLVNEADIDYFRYTAHDTGYLVVNAFFTGGAVAGSDLTLQIRDANDVVLATLNGNSLTGERLVIPVVGQQVYYIRVSGTNPLTDTNNYNLEIENFKAPQPTVVDLLAASDTGRSNSDNITSTIVNGNVTTVDIQADLAAFSNEGIAILSAAQATAGVTPGAAVEVFLDGVSVGFADVLAGTGNTHFRFSFTGQLVEGANKVTAAVRVFDIHNPVVSGRELLGSPPLFIFVDNTAPVPPSLVLNPLDDSGIPGQPLTYNDRITKYAGANFTGTAESNAWIQLTAFDRFATPIPDFGTGTSTAFGQYFIDPLYNLNDAFFFDQDGERLLTANATDVAGNTSTGTDLLIFLDTRGPQVAGVSYRYLDFNGNPVVIDLLNQTIDGTKVATPPITYIDVTMVDQPVRTDNFIYPAANQTLATTPGNYAIIGKKTGNAVIDHVEVLEDATASGTIGMTTYRLFLKKPLADDRYTFKVFDRIQDEAGNALDGDFQPPVLPSGDGNPGGNFVVQFLTVDARAELGFYANGSANLDLNGDFIVNPGANVGDDAITAYAPNGSAVFSGQFYDPAIGTVDGFDRLGTYGKESGRYVFRMDLNNDGDFSDPGEKTIQTSLQINGMPISGNWGPSAINLVNGRLTGSNVGVFDGTTWYLDTNGNNVIESAAFGDRVLKGNMKGLPFTGDFDNDGLTDLGTYLNGVFYLDLTTLEFGGFVSGFANHSFRAALPLAVTGTASKLARPVAADFDADGITDIGLFIPNQTTVPAGQANWYLMNSNGVSWDIAVPSGSVRSFKNAATGNGSDIAATYGSAKALPVVGNFDPIRKTTPSTTPAVQLKTQMASVAQSLADMYFGGTDATDYQVKALRKGKGR